MRSRTDVALFLPSLAGGGAELVFVQLAELFAARGLNIDLVVANSNGPWLNCVSGKVRLIDLKKPKPSSAILSLVKYLRSARPQAVMSALTHANIVLAIAFRLSGIACRCVLSEHASVVALSNEKTTWDYWLTKILCKRLYLWADSVVAVSYGVAQGLTDVFKLPENRSSVIYNPVEKGTIRTKGLEPIKFPWDDRYPVIISIGRLHKQKDFICLIQAFSRLQSANPSHLVILGEGDERKYLEELAESLYIVKDLWMPGFVDNPFAYLAKANLFVLSSQWEGLGNVLIEAIGLGVPVISTRCPSGPEEILGNGRYGHLVPVGDVAALADAMARSLTGDHPQFDSEEALARFQPERVVNQYLQVLGIKT